MVSSSEFANKMPGMTKEVRDGVVAASMRCRSGEMRSRLSTNDV